MPAEEELGAAVAALAEGRLVVFPTDTVYGVAARPDVPGGTDAIFAAKRRPRGLTLPVLAADVTAARTVARLDDRAEALASQFWPGALTLVLPRTEASGAWDLGDEGATVGVRVPAHPMASALLTRTGPLAVTSANRSGEPTPEECDGVRASLGDAVAVYLCAGAVGTVASTVVDLAARPPRLLREGAVSRDELRATLADLT